jgi:hypothetical protein
MADEEHAMDDRDRAEMQALCDQFRREMAREVEHTLFNKEACERIGEMISARGLGIQLPHVAKAG